jgi:hypothetical protein
VPRTSACEKSGTKEGNAKKSTIFLKRSKQILLPQRERAAYGGKRARRTPKKQAYPVHEKFEKNRARFADKRSQRKKRRQKRR